MTRPRGVPKWCRQATSIALDLLSLPSNGQERRVLFVLQRGINCSVVQVCVFFEGVHSIRHTAYMRIVESIMMHNR